MPTYNLTEYCNGYSKTSGSLCEFWWNESKNSIADSKSLKLKSRFIDKTSYTGLIN